MNTFLSNYANVISHFPKWVLFGFLAAMSSGIGQTYLIGLYNPFFIEKLGLTPTILSTTYAIATVGSAAVLLSTGSLINRGSNRMLTVVAVVIGSLACLVAAYVGSIAQLFLAFFLLRLGGQGLFALVSATAMARAFHVQRGTALSLAGSGHAFGEAVLPLGLVFLLQTRGLSESLFIVGGFLVVIILPLLLWLAPPSAVEPKPTPNFEARLRGGRGQFHMLLPLAAAAPFVITLFQFHIGPFLSSKGLTLSAAPALLGFFAGGHLVSLLLAGPFVDRVGASKLVPGLLLPLILAFPTWAFAETTAGLGYGFALCGLTLGANSTVLTALWAERFDLAEIGKLRAVQQATMVFSTAAAPVLGGVLFQMRLDIRMILMVVLIPILFTGIVGWYALLERNG